MNKIFLKPVGGLCNRIRVIGSVLQIAADSGKRVVVIWEKNAELNCSYSELFERSELFDLVETRAFRKFALPFFPKSQPKSFFGKQLFKRTRSKYGLQDSFFFNELNERFRTSPAGNT